MSTHDEYSERYRGEFVDTARNRHAAIEHGGVREAIERENKIQEAVKKLIERIRLR